MIEQPPHISTHHQEFGVSVYIRQPWSLESTPLALFSDRGFSFGGITFHYFGGVSGTKLKQIPRVSPQALMVESHIDAQGSITFYDVPASEWEDKPVVILQIRTALSARNIPVVSIWGPFLAFDAALILKDLRELVEKAKALYGFIVFGPREYVAPHVSWVSQLPVEALYQYGPGGDPQNPLHRFQKEVMFYADRQEQFDQFVPRAAWGNILSPLHIERLGGIEQIRSQSKCSMELWGENLYLQLPASPVKMTTEHLRCLDAYLKPLKFPDAPEPVFPFT